MTDLALASVPPIRRTEVDGVRTLWIDSPGPMVAALVFRVGRSDEPTPMGGISHVVEHLALAGLGVQDYDHNGFVDGRLTVFTNVGRPDEVVDFLRAVVNGLADPPLDRLLLERRILREEREQRGPSVGGALRWYRFGYAGQGRGLGPDDDELGLGWLGPQHVSAWIERHLTRQNAVLWLTGAPPADLRLDGLPDGAPSVAPMIETIPGVPFPAHLAWNGPGAHVAMLAERTSAINIGASIAHRRARQHLRFDRGLVYDVEHDYEPVDLTTAHITLGADCTDERIPAVLDGLIGSLRDLATSGPTQGELDAEMKAYVRQYEERDGHIGFLAATAADVAWGAETFTAQEFLAMRRAVGPAEVSAAVEDALGTLLALANTPSVDGLAPYPGGSTTRVDGQEYGPSGFFLPGRKPKERLFASPDGVSIAVRPGEWLTVRYADAVACVHEADDVRTLLGRDGIRVTVVGQGWKDGMKVVTEIDRSIPAALVACSEHSLGALADPGDGDQPAATADAG